MDEYVDILDESGNKTGEIKLKSEAHAKGFFHPTIHVWFYTPEGELLLQQRSKLKKTFPGLWDVSVAGHISAGEDIVDSAIREIKEEIGLQISRSELKRIGVHKCIQKHNPSLIDCEFHHVFISELKASINNLTLQDSEVEDLKLISITEFREHIKEPNASSKYVILDEAYYDMVLNSIEKEI